MKKAADFHHVRHSKDQITSRKTLWTALILTLSYAIVELAGGLWANSLALLSDSIHMISDVLALGLSVVAIYLARKDSNQRYTFGYLRFEILASLLNGLALIVISLGIAYEGIHRVFVPEKVDLSIVLPIAVVGLLMNLTLTFLLKRSQGEEENLNIQSALWHFIGDLLSSIGVILSTIAIHYTGWFGLDPAVSLLIGGIILVGGMRIVREAYFILMEAVPLRYDVEQIRKDLLAIHGVRDVHELHLWSISTCHDSLTAHVLVRDQTFAFQVVLASEALLRTKYGIHHTTIQIEHAAVHDHGAYGENFLK